MHRDLRHKGPCRTPAIQGFAFSISSLFLFALFANALLSDAWAHPPVNATPQPQRPVPSAEVILEHVRTMAPQERGNDQLFRTRYAFVRTRTTREIDSSGRVKKQRTKESRNNPGLVPASFNLSSERVQATGETTQTNQPKAFEREEFALNDDLLSRFDFKVIGREIVNDRSALVLDFRPKAKDLPARNIKERFINKAAGRVWVDEGDWMLAKVDLFLSEPVNVVGGLVGAVKKFTYRFDRERTADGLWYTTAINWRLEGRELLSRKILEYEEHRSEVKKVR